MGSNRQVQIRTGLSGLTVTLQTAGTYWQVIRPTGQLSMESQVTLVRLIEFDLLTIVTGGAGILRRGPGEERIEFNVPVTATHPVGPTTANQFQPGEVIPTGQLLQGSGSAAGDITFTEAT